MKSPNYFGFLWHFTLVFCGILLWFFVAIHLETNSSCIGRHEALPLTRFGSSLAVIAFSAVLPSFW
jgi:hypothetical protein